VAKLLIEVLECCRKGEQAAFEEIVKRFQSKALDLAKSLIGDKHLAEDAVQSAFMTAFCRLSQLRQPEAFAGWLRQIVRTEALKVIRKNQKSRQEISEQEDNQLSPIEKIEFEELRQIVRKSLSELSRDNRQTAELFYLDEQSCAEVADTLNIPTGTVKRRLYDVRQKLQDVLGDYLEQPKDKRKAQRKKNREIPL
jgi:RNA polymerase sigma-70 factor (ECF subfamily)